MLTPLVSVILPVYNCEAYIKECVDSILEQTYKNFEVLIFNDGSTDRTKSILSGYNDSRIKITHKTQNAGYVKLLNEGISIASGKYICRMDADDICYKERFAIQVDFMEKHQSVGVCGSFAYVFGNNLSYIWKFPITNESLKVCLLFRIPFVHPSVIIRKSVLHEHNIRYKDDFLPAEDYEIWNNLAAYTQFANIPKPLIKYRQHQKQISKEKRIVQRNNSDLIREIYFKHFFSNEENFDLYQNIVNEKYELNKEFLIKCLILFNHLEQKNRELKIFDKFALREELSYQGFNIATHISSNKVKTIKILFNSKYKKSFFVTRKLFLKYIIKNIF